MLRPGPPTLPDLIAARLTRRGLLQGAAGAGFAAALAPLLPGAAASASTRALAFTELARVEPDTPTHHVAPGYRADVLIAWGDALFPDSPAFDPSKPDAAAQARQFGFNNDFIAFLPLAEGEADKAAHLASASSARGLLCVNHEYSYAPLMFAGMPTLSDARELLTDALVRVEMASLGHSVVEIARGPEGWRVNTASAFNRRIDATTPMDVSGPARGHARMRTAEDPDGVMVRGTTANCAGGVTPWGTVLSAEENVQQYFSGAPSRLSAAHWREAAGAESFGVGLRAQWIKAEARFDLEKEPHEFNRFGWLVEIDPYDPASRPRKLTALGRFRHEAATVIAEEGRPLVIYMGDDQALEFVYKYVSRAPYRAADTKSHAALVDEGTLYAARFEEDGTGRWLPLVLGEGPLTAENGFDTQADVLIDTRRAARLLGATETDRPEDIETDPATGRSYIAFTGGTSRAAPAPVAPRAPNERGHIVELLAPGTDGARDHSSTDFTWAIFLMAGHPEAEAASRGVYGPGISAAGWFANPDNMVFDPSGRLWIATDGGRKTGVADGLWATEILGPGRAVTRHFFACPRGAELCGPCFTPDGTTLFVAVQHPGQEDGSSFDAPSTRWPASAESALPPRSSVVAITRDGGGPIGG